MSYKEEPEEVEPTSHHGYKRQVVESTSHKKEVIDWNSKEAQDKGNLIFTDSKLIFTDNKL